MGAILGRRVAHQTSHSPRPTVNECQRSVLTSGLVGARQRRPATPLCGRSLPGLRRLGASQARSIAADVNEALALLQAFRKAFEAGAA